MASSVRLFPAAGIRGSFTARNATAGPSRLIRTISSASRPTLAIQPAPRRLISSHLSNPTWGTHLTPQSISTSSQRAIHQLFTRTYASTSPSIPQPPTTSPTAEPFISPSPSSPSSSASSTSTPPPNPESEPEPEPTSAYARLKLLTKKYGWYALGMYVFLSTIDFSFSFFVVHSVGSDRIEGVINRGWRIYRVQRYGEDETRRLEEEDERKKVEVEAEKLKDEAESGKVNGKGKGKGNGGWGSRTFWAEVALAYAIHKTALLPVRAGLTVAWTPKVVEWLAARGWVGKGGMTRAATHAQGKLKDASGKLKDSAERVRERAKRGRE